MKITIASGKGGTGKTTISTNLASYLTSLGKQIVLADLDVEEPNGALFLEAKLVEDTWRPVELKKGIFQHDTIYFEKNKKKPIRKFTKLNRNSKSIIHFF